MAGPTTGEPPPSGKSAGTFEHLSALIAAKLGYLRARLQLAGIEGREAAVHGAILLGLLLAALVVLVFGYFFLVLAIVFLVALAFGGGSAWIWVLIAAAALHILGAVVLVLIARSRLGTPLFPLTLDELRKDQEWLTKTTKPN